jgi:hypothetical protein
MNIENGGAAVNHPGVMEAEEIEMDDNLIISVTT